MRVGAIDIGSNSIRLLVADVSDGGPVVSVARAGEPCRLGRDLERTGSIQRELADRAAHIASGFADRARALGATRLVAGATAALRNAANGPDVAELIGSRCGVAVRILSGDDEARLVYGSVLGGLGGVVRHSPCIVFDIGGGSTEIVSGVGLNPGRWTSLPFGAVSLTERYLRSNPPTAAERQALAEGVHDKLMQACAFMPAETPVLAGVGGTITVMAMLDRRLSAYDPTSIEGWRIPQQRALQLVDELSVTSEETRRAWPAMGQGRADIVVAGSLVVRAVIERFPSEALTCSTQGLRYGLARLAAEEARNGGDKEVHD